MFNLDIDKLEAEEAKREQMKKDYGDISPEEVEILKMRESYLKEQAEVTSKSLEKLDEKVSELSDDNTIISEDMKRAAEKFDEENKTTEETSEDEEVEQEEETEEIQSEEEEENTADVESEAKNEVSEEWLKEKQELERVMKEKDDLLIKMYQELQNKQQAVTPETKQDTKEPIKAKNTINKDDVKSKVKEAFEKMSYADEEAASDILTETILSLAQNNSDDGDMDSKLEALLAKREQEKAVKQFETAKEAFFNSEEGKKVLADDDMFDLYKVKFERLQKSGKHLNPEGLFEEAYKMVNPVAKKTDSSTAKKVTPKVSDSLKDDVSKVEETKKQAVKPAGSSNASKIAETKKFDAVEAWKELQRQMGQEI